jgi:hypothetical protein
MKYKLLINQSVEANEFQGLDKTLSDYLDTLDLNEAEVTLLNHFIQLGATSIHQDLLKNEIDEMDLELVLKSELFKKKKGFIVLSRKAKCTISSMAFLIIQHKLQREKQTF